MAERRCNASFLVVPRSETEARGRGLESNMGSVPALDVRQAF